MSYSDNDNISDDGQVMAPSPIQPAPGPTEIVLQQPVYPPGILPIRMLKVAGVAFGPTAGMSQEEADDRLLALNEPPPAPVLQVANMDDPTSQTLAPPIEPEPGPEA